MSEFMIVMMVVMMVSIFGAGHKGMMSGADDEKSNVNKFPECDKNTPSSCLQKSVMPLSQ